MTLKTILLFYLHISKIVSQKITPLQTSKALETPELFLFKQQQLNQFPLITFFLYS